MAFNTTGAAGGAAQGALLGAQLGGPWGAAAGGAVGLLAGGFMGGGGSPPDTTKEEAAMVRADYNRYLDTYQPLQDALYERVNNWGQETTDKQNVALQRSGRQFEKSQGALARDQRSMGIEMTPEQKASLRRKYDVAAATAAVNAANTTGRQMDEQYYALAGGFGPYKAGG